MKKERLGERLLRLKLITPEQLDVAVRESKRTGELLGETLLRLGFVNQEQLTSILSQQKGIREIEIGSSIIEPDVINLVPKNIAARYQVIPISKEDNELILGMVNPFDIDAVDTVSRLTGMNVEPASIKRENFNDAFKRYYGKTESIDKIIDDVLNQRVPPGEVDNRIISIVNYIMLKAVRERATDVHIEAAQNVTRVRYRIDGVMSLGFILPKAIHQSIVTRIKLISNLNISETRLPQDGRTTFRVGQREIDTRVSILPSIYGEVVVLRLLRTSEALPELDKLGFSEDQLDLLRKAIVKPFGMILITGPTGSGKTTSLYAALKDIFTVEKAIITVEDPVEYRWDLVRQVQVNPKIGLTFATALRSILRQDPDIMLIGEIRDKETAQIAVEAALTGHLVFSTLHTNDAVSSVIRMVDLGIPRFLIGNSLLCVSAQRLVRKICPYCKQPYYASDGEKNYLGVPRDKELQLYKGKGCEKCNFKGYLGRTAVTEIVLLDEKFREAVISGASVIKLRSLAAEKGFKTMFDDGKRKVLKGITTVDELKRVIG